MMCGGSTSSATLRGRRRPHRINPVTTPITFDNTDAFALHCTNVSNATIHTITIDSTVNADMPLTSLFWNLSKPA